MRLRFTSLAIVCLIAWLAYLASALAVEKHREALNRASFAHADYPMCIREEPPEQPLEPKRKGHPLNGDSPVSDLS